MFSKYSEQELIDYSEASVVMLSNDIKDYLKKVEKGFQNENALSDNEKRLLTLVLQSTSEMVDALLDIHFGIKLK